MKIVNVEVLLISEKLQKPWVMGLGTATKRDEIIVRVHTDEGIVGIGFAAAVKTAAFQKQAATEGLMVQVDEPRQFADYVSAEEKRWRKVVQDAHIPLLN